MPATIRDVARLAGVGRGTVSRVINNSPGVSPTTRARVLKAIGELEFLPSALGRRLSTGRTGAIAVVAPFMTRQSAVERLRGIEGVLSTAGHDMVVFNVETRARRDAVIADLLRGDRVDGTILLAVTPDAGELEIIRRKRLPIVLLDAWHPHTDRVVINDLGGGQLAACHLMDLGHRRIAFLGELPRVALNLPASRLRHRGVRAALRRNGLDMPSEYSAVGWFGPAGTRELVSRLLTLDRVPTGIICASDHQALSVLEAARDHGFEVPRDISVVGYDDLDVAAYAGLTTIHQPLYESGMRAARLLLDRMLHPDGPPVREVVDVELVLRSTTAPPIS